MIMPSAAVCYNFKSVTIQLNFYADEFNSYNYQIDQSYKNVTSRI